MEEGNFALACLPSLYLVDPVVVANVKSNFFRIPRYTYNLFLSKNAPGVGPHWNYWIISLMNFWTISLSFIWQPLLNHLDHILWANMINSLLIDSFFSSVPLKKPQVIQPWSSVHRIYDSWTFAVVISDRK